MSRIDFLLETPIAHRGLHNSEVPENSLTAFQKAVDKHLPIELDVHVLKSGEVVVFHDMSLKRMCGIRKRIKNCTYDEIHRLRLKGTNERIPLLSEVLKLVAGQVPLLIEIKYDKTPGKTEAPTLNILSSYKGKYAVQSFNPLSVRWFKKHAPNIPRGQLSRDYGYDKTIPPPIRVALKNLWFFPITSADFISYNYHSLPNRYVARLRRKGVPVLCWTIKNQAESKDAAQYCDNQICENIL